MADLRARVAYLQGLVEGMAVEDETPHGRVLTEIVDILGDVATAVVEVQEVQAGLEEYIDEVDEDLTDLAGDVYLEDDADGEGEPEPLGELCCSTCGQTLALEAGEVNGRETLGVVCSQCGTLVGSVDHAPQ